MYIFPLGIESCDSCSWDSVSQVYIYFFNSFQFPILFCFIGRLISASIELRNVLTENGSTGAPFPLRSNAGPMGLSYYK